MRWRMRTEGATRRQQHPFDATRTTPVDLIPSRTPTPSVPRALSPTTPSSTPPASPPSPPRPPPLPHRPRHSPTRSQNCDHRGICPTTATQDSQIDPARRCQSKAWAVSPTDRTTRTMRTTTGPTRMRQSLAEEAASRSTRRGRSLIARDRDRGRRTPSSHHPSSARPTRILAGQAMGLGRRLLARVPPVTGRRTSPFCARGLGQPVQRVHSTRSRNRDRQSTTSPFPFATRRWGRWREVWWTTSGEGRGLSRRRGGRARRSVSLGREGRGRSR
jgi:hypothetical protein